MQRHPWVLMGPDSNEMLKPGFKSLYKYAGLVVYRNNRKKLSYAFSHEINSRHYGENGIKCDKESK